MLILGLDPGTATTGYGVIEAAGRQAVYVAHGRIETPRGLPHPERLQMIHRAVARLIAKYAPDLVAVERLFFTKNTKTAMDVAEARGVIILACADENMKIIEFTPNQVKQAVTGQGAAPKAQVQEMVRRVLALRERISSDDAADALAIAICASHASRLSGMVGR